MNRTESAQQSNIVETDFVSVVMSNLDSDDEEGRNFDICFVTVTKYVSVYLDVFDAQLQVVTNNMAPTWTDILSPPQNFSFFQNCE